ncbi:uncharacterized protein MYCFIDRAFT_173583 [Pseudocercospora fijiensis CIRAD86]|uniref:Uncharacterized protein n=1 Tax=Pseudocercospora fijiensis (strain CIRAD86) TaxID=383855 RepID=M3A0E8_PSEFD|nr:uncharacterized protein MYCFIDRAFT_173583 [Pseudocercospora fijiensis CIRAD86]EME84634.1 hypothetical protein MYCFIDRAFT_173583 [Pseudocercospora fijiensis CIRAD86]
MAIHHICNTKNPTMRRENEFLPAHLQRALQGWCKHHHVESGMLPRGCRSQIDESRFAGDRPGGNLCVRDDLDLRGSKPADDVVLETKNTRDADQAQLQPRATVIAVDWAVGPMDSGARPECDIRRWAKECASFARCDNPNRTAGLSFKLESCSALQDNTRDSNLSRSRSSMPSIRCCRPSVTAVHPPSHQSAELHGCIGYCLLDSELSALGCLSLIHELTYSGLARPAGFTDNSYTSVGSAKGGSIAIAHRSGRTCHIQCDADERYMYVRSRSAEICRKPDIRNGLKSVWRRSTAGHIKAAECLPTVWEFRNLKRDGMNDGDYMHMWPW